MRSDVDDFLDGTVFAVVGASSDRRKFGNRVLRCYWDFGLTAHPVNPNATAIEGATCFASLADLPETPDGVSLITQPRVSEQIVEQAAELGIERLWFQPGAESRRALDRAHHHGIRVIAGGPCLLVELPRRPRVR